MTKQSIFSLCGAMEYLALLDAPAKLRRFTRKDKMNVAPATK
jgi:hypothetical protein